MSRCHHRVGPIVLAAALAALSLPSRAHALPGTALPSWPFRDASGLPALGASDRAGDSGSTAIDLMVGYAARSSGKAEIIGGVALSVPFDRAISAGAPRAPTTGASLGAEASPSDRSGAPRDRAGSAERARSGAASLPPEPGPRATHSGGPIEQRPTARPEVPDVVEPCEEEQASPDAAPRARSSAPNDWRPPRIRARDLRSAVAAAQRSASLGRDDEALADLATRARWSAAMPELRLRATRLVDESESLAPTEYDASRTTASGATSLWLEARGTWKLDRAVFADEEIRVARLRFDLEREHDRLRARVVALLFDWQRAAVVLERDAHDPAACWESWLAFEQLGAELDWLTGGWFASWARADPSRRPTVRCGRP